MGETPAVDARLAGWQARIEAALDHGNATQNYLPLCAVLGLIPHGEDTALPEKKAKTTKVK